jgi:hypothetical protein
MGATYMAQSVPGATAGEALELLRERLRAEFGDPADPDVLPWGDPFLKGCVQVRDEAVTDEAIGWMRAWCEQQLPEPREPGDIGGKFGPWLAFPLASGGWHFFGWVND